MVLFQPRSTGLIDNNVLKIQKNLTICPHTQVVILGKYLVQFKHYNMLKGVHEVVEHLCSPTPNGKWVQDNGQDIHPIMTGGESVSVATSLR